MITGTGLPYQGFSPSPSHGTGKGFFGLNPVREQNNSPYTGDVPPTSEGLEALQSIEKGLVNLQDQAARLAFRQLQELQKRLELTENLLGAADPAQAGLINKQLDEITRELGKVGQQIVGLLRSGDSSISAEQLSLSLTATFNFTATDSKGNTISYSEKLNLEFKSFNLKATGGDGSEIQATVTELSLSREETLLVSTEGETYPPPVDLQALINEFRDTVRQLGSLLGLAHDFFHQKPLIPQPFLDMLRDIVSAEASGKKSRSLLVNQTA